MQTQLTISASLPTLEYKEDDTLERLLSKPFVYNTTTPNRMPKKFLVTEPEFGPCRFCGKYHVLVNNGMIIELPSNE